MVIVYGVLILRLLMIHVIYGRRRKIDIEDERL